MGLFICFLLFIYADYCSLSVSRSEFRHFALQPPKRVFLMAPSVEGLNCNTHCCFHAEGIAMT